MNTDLEKLNKHFLIIPFCMAMMTLSKSFEKIIKQSLKYKIV